MNHKLITNELHTFYILFCIYIYIVHVHICVFVSTYLPTLGCGSTMMDHAHQLWSSPVGDGTAKYRRGKRSNNSPKPTVFFF